MTSLRCQCGALPWDCQAPDAPQDCPVLRALGDACLRQNEVLDDGEVDRRLQGLEEDARQHARHEHN